MRKLSLILCLVIVLFNSCDRRKVTRMDTATSGVAQIMVDETLAPVIQQQIDVFEGLNPEATIIPIYTSEVEIFSQLKTDSVRLIIAARELTDAERRIIEEEHKRAIRSQKLATDGIALIVNKENTDTLITVSDLKKIFTGEVDSWGDLYPDSKLGKIAVSFDSPNSSMARYIKDSICVGASFGSNITARTADNLQTIDTRTEETANQKVINFVASTPNAMGIIGANWISNPNDSTNLSFVNNVKVMSVSTEQIATTKNSYQPYPYQIALGQYPLTRSLYIILSDVRGGLPAGFVHFSAGDQGQRIITKAGLLPATRPTRMVRVLQD